MCRGADRSDEFQAFDIMRHRGLPFTSGVVYCLLQQCLETKDLLSTRRMYAFMVSNGLDTRAFLGDHLIRFFADCGSLREASEVFYKIPKPTIYTWNAIISACAKFGKGERALELYADMKKAGIKPDKITLLSLMKACVIVGCLEWCKLIHRESSKRGLKTDVAVGNTTVDMYAKCGNLKGAREVFENMPNRDVVSWSVMIAGYVMHGHGFTALNLFERMQQEGIKPNILTFSSALKACASIDDLKQGCQIHAELIRSPLESDLVVGSTLIDMYSKCGGLIEARKVFDDLRDPDLVSWSAMISGYAMHEDGIAALELYGKMQQGGLKPNRVTFLCSLKACGCIGAFDQCKIIHDEIIRSGFDVDALVGSSLVDVYAKCGTPEESCKVFDNIPDRDEVTWAAVIAGHSINGNCKLAEQCLENMQEQGLKPGDAIFTSILTACGQAGLLEEGYLYFRSARETCVAPSVEQYCCMIDLLGRSGKLNEAMAMLLTMPVPPDIIVWRCLLACCKIYGNLELGRQCFDQSMEMDPVDASGYVLMSNMYADSNMWKNVDQIEVLRKSAGAQKQPGIARLDIRNKVQEFMVGAKINPQDDHSHTMLLKLLRLMKQDGYVPQSDLVLELVADEYQKCWP